MELPFPIPLTDSNPEWIAVALADIDSVFQDHLHCERKAAQSALSMLRNYPTHADIARVVTRLAHEETAHVIQMESLLRERGQVPTYDSGDDFARKLRAKIRKGEPGRLLDTLIVFALIEARSAERLRILSENLREDKTRKLYASLATAETRHRDSFLQLALARDTPDVIWARVRELAEFEASLIATLPLQARIH